MASKSFRALLSFLLVSKKQNKKVNKRLRAGTPVMKTVLADIYMDFSTTLVPDADKWWKSGDEAYKNEVCVERAEW